jgi:hypothetical protein
VSSLIRLRLYTHASEPPSEFAKLILSWRNQAIALTTRLLAKSRFRDTHPEVPERPFQSCLHRPQFPANFKAINMASDPKMIRLQSGAHVQTNRWSRGAERQ